MGDAGTATCGLWGTLPVPAPETHGGLARRSFRRRVGEGSGAGQRSKPAGEHGDTDRPGTPLRLGARREHTQRNLVMPGIRFCDVCRAVFEPRGRAMYCSEVCRKRRACELGSKYRRHKYLRSAGLPAGNSQARNPALAPAPAAPIVPQATSPRRCLSGIGSEHMHTASTPGERICKDCRAKIDERLKGVSPRMYRRCEVSG